MLKEDAVAAANGHFAVTLGVPSKTNARRGIEEVSFQASGLRGGTYGRTGERVRYQARNERGSTGTAALNDAVEGIAGARDEGTFLSRNGAVVNHRRAARRKGRWVRAEWVGEPLAIN